MSMQINITDYESLLAVAKQQTEPQRLLFVFLKASLPEQHNDEEVSRFHAGQGGALRPIMCVDKPLDELGSFSDLATESEKMGQDWQIVLTAALSGRDGIAPNANDAELPLKMMIQTVENGGDLSRYLAFDRNGVLVHFG